MVSSGAWYWGRLAHACSGELSEAVAGSEHGRTVFGSKNELFWCLVGPLVEDVQVGVGSTVQLGYRVAMKGLCPELSQKLFPT